MPKSLATDAPEHGGFTNAGEEFLDTQCSTSQLRLRKASSRAAQATEDQLRTQVVLPAAINDGGWFTPVELSIGGEIQGDRGHDEQEV